MQVPWKNAVKRPSFDGSIRRPHCEPHPTKQVARRCEASFEAMLSQPVLCFRMVEISLAKTTKPFRLAMMPSKRGKLRLPSEKGQPSPKHRTVPALEAMLCALCREERNAKRLEKKNARKPGRFFGLVSSSCTQIAE